MATWYVNSFEAVRDELPRFFGGPELASTLVSDRIQRGLTSGYVAVQLAKRADQQRAHHNLKLVRCVALAESSGNVGPPEVDVDAARHFETGLVRFQIAGSDILDVARAEDALVFQQRHIRIPLDGAREVVRYLTAPHAAAQRGT